MIPRVCRAQAAPPLPPVAPASSLSAWTGKSAVN